MESKNWYAPSEVTVRKMTEEEKRNYEAEKAKYPWRYNKRRQYGVVIVKDDGITKIHFTISTQQESGSHEKLL